jgi:hypothetical protein
MCSKRGAYALASRWKVRPSFCVPGALPVLIASSEGAVRRDSRPSRRAIKFNSWSAPIMVSRSTQASMVRAFFMATSNTCVRLSIIASPRSFDDGRQRANPGDGSDKDGGWFAAAGQGIRNAGDSPRQRAFEAELAGMGEDGRAVALDMFIEPGCRCWPWAR